MVLEVFKPVFSVGFISFIFIASLNKIMLKFLQWSIILVLSITKLMRDVVQILYEKEKERYMNDVLSTHGVIKTVWWKITSTSVLKCSTNLLLQVKV